MSFIPQPHSLYVKKKMNKLLYSYINSNNYSTILNINTNNQSSFFENVIDINLLNVLNCASFNNFNVHKLYGAFSSKLGSKSLLPKHLQFKSIWGLFLFLNVGKYGMLTNILDDAHATT